MCLPCPRPSAAAWGWDLGCISAVRRFLRSLLGALRERVECRQEGTCGFPRPHKATHTGGREFTVGAVFPASGWLPTGTSTEWCCWEVGIVLPFPLFGEVLLKEVSV